MYQLHLEVHDVELFMPVWLELSGSFE